jgi:hypothetical protein
MCFECALIIFEYCDIVGSDDQCNVSVYVYGNFFLCASLLKCSLISGLTMEVL